MSESNEAKKKSWWQRGGNRIRPEEFAQLNQLAQQQAAEITELKSKIRELKSVQQATQQTLVDANQETSDWQRRHKQLSQTIDTYKEDKRKWDDERAQLHQREKALGKVAKEQSDQIDELTGQRQSGTDERKALREQVQQLQRTIETERAERKAQDGTLAKLRTAYDETEKKRLALEEIVRETSELLQRKSSDCKQTEAKLQEASEALSLAKFEITKIQKQHKQSQQNTRKHSASQQEQLQWLWRITLETAKASCGQSAALAITEAWERCIGEWSTALLATPDASLDQQLPKLAEILSQTGLCQQLTWTKEKDGTLFHIKLDKQTNTEDFAPSLQTPIPLLLVALTQQFQESQVRLVSCTPTNDAPLTFACHISHATPT